QNLLFLVAFIAFASSPRDKQAPGGRIRYLLPLLMLGLFFTASFINTQATFVPRIFWKLWDPYENIMNYKALMTCFVAYALASLGATTKDDLIAIFTAGVAGIGVEAGYSALEYLVFHPGRVTGHMGEPNSLGSYLAGSFGLMLGLVLVLPRSH